MAGTTKLDRLQENVAAASIELSEVEQKQIAHALDGINVEGTRYQAGVMATTGR